MPTPAFRALFGTGMGIGPGTPIDLLAPSQGTNVGVGGDGESRPTPEYMLGFLCNNGDLEARGSSPISPKRNTQEVFGNKVPALPYSEVQPVRGTDKIGSY